jgi:hypothetical protein
MLSYTQFHSKAGIAEVRLMAVEQIRENLGDAKWEFIESGRDTDLAPVMATIGNARHGQPDIVLGVNLTDKQLGIVRETIGNLLAYLEWHKEPVDGDLDIEDYYAFVVQHRGYTTVPPIKPTDRLHLRRIDKDRWFAGQGWQHAAFYTEDERASAQVIQLVFPDEQGRLPNEEGYNNVPQVLLDVEPFGATVEFDQHPARQALAKYLH